MDRLFEKGIYTAQYGETGALIAMDEYTIEQIPNGPNGFKIKSDNVIFGQNGFRQCAEMWVDESWMMQKIHIVVDQKNIELLANVDGDNVKIWQQHGQREFEKIIPLQMNKFFFLYSGALALPFIWLRGFNYGTFEKIQYQLFPTGQAEVMQIKKEDKPTVYHFSINMYIGEMTDLTKIETDHTGKMLLFQSASTKLIIKPQLSC